jgi:hypothetical protein
VFALAVPVEALIAACAGVFPAGKSADDAPAPAAEPEFAGCCAGAHKGVSKTASAATRIEKREKEKRRKFPEHGFSKESMNESVRFSEV